MEQELIQCLEIIQEKSEIADESMGKFVIECMNEAENSQAIASMPEALYKVLCPTPDDYKEVLGIIVNDEKYFKWDSLDRFNKSCAASPHSWDNEFHILGLAFIYLKNFGVTGVNIGKVMRSAPPEIDFFEDISMISGDIKFAKQPYCVGGDCYKSLLTLLPEDDTYAGIIVSRDKYPQASDKALKEEHIASCQMRTNGKAVSIDRAGYLAPRHISFAEKLGSIKNIPNPGLIYIPAKKVLELSTGGTILGTVLPRHILEKYNLPILEV